MIDFVISEFTDRFFAISLSHVIMLISSVAHYYRVFIALAIISMRINIIVLNNAIAKILGRSL